MSANPSAVYSHAQLNRRWDGVCPACKTAEKAAGYSYCMPCRRVYQRLMYRQNIKKVPTRAIDATVEARRMAVLRLLCKGQRDKQIQAELTINAATIKNDKQWLRSYSQSRSLVQLGAWAVRQGLV